MPKKLFALEPEGPKVVRLEWKGAFKNLQVHVHDSLVGAIESRKALSTGTSFALEDGSTLTLRLEGGLMPALAVLRDGVPLPGSDKDPATQMRGSAGVIYFIAGVNALVGVLAIMFDNETLRGLAGDYGVAALLTALLYSVLAYFTMGGSVVALVLAMLFYVADWVSSFAMSISEGGNPAGGLIVRILFLVLMSRGLKGGLELRKQHKAKAARTE